MNTDTALCSICEKRPFARIRTATVKVWRKGMILSQSFKLRACEPCLSRIAASSGEQFEVS